MLKVIKVAFEIFSFIPDKFKIHQKNQLFTNTFIISEDVMSLVLSERKSINTLTYLILIIMAYFGPNAKLLGNIQLKIWQYQRPIVDIEAYIIKVSLLMAVDIGSLVINGIVIWKSCGINVMEILKKLQKSYWIFFALAEAYVLMEVIYL